MAIWTGYIGLAVGFLLLAAMLLWIVIASKGGVFLKAILIPVTTWYGAVLFLTAQNMMGWPVERSVPEQSYILAYRVKEPDPASGYPGAIFIWATRPQSYASEAPRDAGIAINPQNLFDYQDKSDPRAYRLPYDRDIHKMLLEASKSQQNRPGSLIKVQKGKKRGPHAKEGDKSLSKLNLDIINPLELLPRKNQ